jgi:hypothetical protein
MLLVTLLVTLLGSLLPAAALADSGATAARGRSPWLGFGLGGGGFSGVGGIAGHVDLGWGFGKLYLAGRLAGVTDSLECCETTEGDRTDAALLVGLQGVTRSRALSIGVGPASVHGQGLAGRTWGVGFEARLVMWGRRAIGPALYVFANVNSRSSFFGLTVGVHFGGR